MLLNEFTPPIEYESIRNGQLGRGEKRRRRYALPAHSIGLAAQDLLVGRFFISVRIMQTMQSDVDAGGAFVRESGAWKGETKTVFG